MRHTHLTVGRLRTALVAGLLLIGSTVVGPAFAADQPTTSTQTAAAQVSDKLGPHTHQLHGVVKSTPSSGATTFTLTTERFGDVTVSFAGATPKGRGHGRGRARSFESTRAGDLKQGDRVVVQGHSSADGSSFVARRVHVLPAEQAAAHPSHLVGTISGVATSSSGTTLTLKLADGTTQSVVVSADTKIRPNGKTVADLTTGKKVTVVSRNGAATGVVILPA